jgi:hypothetical protein
MLTNHALFNAVKQQEVNHNVPAITPPRNPALTIAFSSPTPQSTVSQCNGPKQTINEQQTPALSQQYTSIKSLL